MRGKRFQRPCPRQDGAGTQAVDTLNGAKRGAFACAVRANQGYDFALFPL